MDADELRRMTRYHRVVRRLYADPRFPGRHRSSAADLRALAVTFAWVGIVELPPPAWSRVKELLHLSEFGFRETIAQDIPRYEGPHVSGCSAPMIRREGPCGHQRTITGFRVTNPADGTWAVLNYCNRHWEYSGQVYADEQARQGKGVPEPFPNTGGLFPVHFPQFDWEPSYAWASGHRGWKPPAAGISADDWPPLAPAGPVSGHAPPDLKVITGDSTAPEPETLPPPDPRRLQLVPSWDDNKQNE